MHMGGFRLHRDLGRFISKRLLRLEPPYLASIVLVLVLLFLSSHTPGFRGQQPEVTVTQVLLHLAYLNAFFGDRWLSPVYWTLAIEFQYYLLACFSYPLMFSSTPWLRWALVAGLFLAALWTENDALLFHWLGLFMLGTVGCFFVTKTVRGLELISLGVVALVATYMVNGALIASIGVSAVIAIVKLSHLRFRVLAFLGTISYSLYLLHVPIGGRVINLASRLDQSWARDLGAMLVAMGVSLLSAWCWYRYIERPSIEWAARVKYSGRDQQVEAGKP